MKKAIQIIVLTIVCLFGFQIGCHAFMPSDYVGCDIAADGIPKNAVYVDLLLPMGEDDERYVPFHASNGELFGVSADSGIAQYREDGYVSYTFHYQEAVSHLIPYEYDATTMCVDFGLDTDHYDHIRKAYSYVKLAYVDEAGDVVGVTNAVRVTDFWECVRGEPYTDLFLNGTTLSVDFVYGPPIGLVFVGFGVVVTVTVLLITVRKARKGKSPKKPIELQPSRKT